MNTRRTAGARVRAAAAAVAAGILVLFLEGSALAHCDTLDGLVVSDARAALEAGDAGAVLKWVKAEGEAEAREAFARAVAVRKLGPDARALADSYFFETLVRLHRAGEGAPYTGLKPAGEVEPPIAAADKALASGSVEGLVDDVKGEVGEGIRLRFERVAEARKHKDESVEAGREFVEAYVIYAHYVEGLHVAIGGGAPHHGEAGAEGGGGH